MHVQRIGRFTVVRELGHGGMGSVYLAQDPELQRDVAIKLLHLTSAGVSGARAQFREEARALARMSHPGIVTIFEIGEHEGQQFIAMEYLRGRSLRELLVNDRPPRDRMLVRADPTVATVPPPGSVAGTLFGTPAYMAPEILRGNSASKASDAYSLGVMLYECLAGKRPYDAKGLAELIEIVIESPAPPQLDDPLAPLVASLLAPVPADRPSLEEVADTLAPMILVSARHVTLPTHPPPPPLRRSRAPWLAGIAIAALAIGGVTWAMSRTTSGSAEPTVISSPPPTIAIERIDATLTGWGEGPPQAQATADVLAKVVDGTGGMRVISPTQLGTEVGHDEMRDGAQRLGARYLAKGTLVQHGERVTGTIEFVDLVDATAETLVAEGTVRELARVIDTLAERVVARFVPGARITRPDRARARVLLDVGVDKMMNQQWNAARPYLEQAIVTDPSLTDAWHYIAAIRGWTIAPAALTRDATDKAVELEANPVRRQIWIGARQFFRGELTDCVATLEPLLARPDLTPDEQTNVLFYLGDAHWHDGEPTRAMTYFRKLVDRPIPFLPAKVHTRQYVIAHREFRDAGDTQEKLRNEFLLARGDYQALARSDAFPFNLHATLILREPAPPALVGKLADVEAAVYRIAASPDRVSGARAFAAGWSTLQARGRGNGDPLFEVVLASELPEAARQLQQTIANAGPRDFSDDRIFEALAAPFVDPKPRTFPRQG